jgi:hypothetical protein
MTACAPDARYAGDVQGTDAYLAVVASDTELIGYACNGAEGVSIAQWFHGAVAPDMTFAIEEKGARIEGAIAPDTISGTLRTADGASHEFELAIAQGDDGLYRDDASHDDYVAGWIVRGEGERGAVRAPDGTVHAFERTIGESGAVAYRYDGLTFERNRVIAVSHE